MIIMNRIVFISPYKDMKSMALAIADELSISLEVYVGGMDDLPSLLNQIKKDPPVDVFVSRGGNAGLLGELTGTPVIQVRTGPFDVLSCIAIAKEISCNIALTSYREPFLGTELMEKTMGVMITPIIFSNMIDLERQIQQAADEGQYCVVGGGPSVNFANKYGLPSVFLSTSPENIKDAILRAVEIGNSNRIEKRKNSRLTAILDSIYDGVIVVNQEGQIELINSAAARILRCDAASLTHKNVIDSIPNTQLDKVLRNGLAEIGEIQTIRNVHIVTNRVPIKDGEHTVGAVATFQEVAGVMKAERKVRREITAGGFKARFNFQDVIGTTPIMEEKKEMAKWFAESNLTVLIYGPSGTGKELFAQSIHNYSSRCCSPFVAVNCGALPPSLLESELFGYEEGAFTGASRKGKSGLFELAHTGTIFLDEIEALPIELQSRLLRVLQEREVIRVGGEQIIPVDIRVIAATNQSPDRLVADKKMRSDLFYRLSVLYLEIPSLAMRKPDIPLLCQHFLGPDACKDLKPVMEKVMYYFAAYSWPGNIRELYNIVQRLAFFRKKSNIQDTVEEILQKICPEILAATRDEGEPKSQQNEEPVTDLRNELALHEREYIDEIVKDSRNMEEAAKRLGIGLSTLWRKVKKIREEEKN